MKKIFLILLLVSELSQFAFSQTAPTNVNVYIQKSPSLYHGVTQSQSTFISQYVPGISDALKDYAKSVGNKDRQNHETYKEIMSWLNKAIAAVPDFDTATNEYLTNYHKLLLSYGERHATDFSASKAYLTGVIADFKTFADDYSKSLSVKFLEQSTIEYNNEHYSRSIEYATSSLTLELPSHLAYLPYFIRGRSLYYLHEYNSAIKDINVFIQQRQSANTLMNPYYFRSLAKWNLNNHSEAIEDMSKHLNEFPKDAVAYYYRAQEKEELKDYTGAILDYDKAIILKPDYAAATYLRGYAKFLIGNVDDAIIDINSGIGLDHLDKSGYRYRAEIKLSRRDYKGCIEDCNKVIIGSPTDAPNSYLIRGRAYYRLNNKAKACEDWSKAGEQGNKDAYTFISKFCN